MRCALIITLTFATVIASAQSKHPTTFGFKAGINWSVINGRELDGTFTGFFGTEAYAALFADAELNTKWKFESELLFSWTDEYMFLEIPLHWKYLVAKKTYILLGPKLDMVISNDDEMYDFTTLGLSVELGVQYEFTKRIFSELRYSQGLVKQVTDRGLDIYGGKRNTLRLGLGVRF